MKKTGKYIAGMLLAMGMSLAGAVSGFAAPDPGTDGTEIPAAVPGRTTRQPGIIR